MSDAIYSNWKNCDFYYPRPNQDSELLRHLGFIPGLQELLALRQVHALEHATVWLLSNNLDSFDRHHNANTTRSQDNEHIGGLSTERGFFLYGDIELLKLRRAVNLALYRLKQGEWNLAIHPRCGTNASVEMFLTFSMTLTAHLLLPREPIEQLLGLGLAATAAAYFAPSMGVSAQKYLTTAIPFNLKICGITKTVDMWNRSAHFVRLEWQNSQ